MYRSTSHQHREADSDRLSAERAASSSHAHTHHARAFVKAPYRQQRGPGMPNFVLDSLTLCPFFPLYVVQLPFLPFFFPFLRFYDDRFHIGNSCVFHPTEGGIFLIFLLAAAAAGEKEV